MGKHVSVTASDHFKLGAYRAEPKSAPKGALVVIQEIFGVNLHIRSICDRLAEAGYVAEAPALFDRQQPNFESGYTPDEVAAARKFIANPDWDAMLRDAAASISDLKSVGPVGIIGFCMGGTVAFLAATRLSGLSVAVGFYGGGIAKNADEKPKCPVQLHFGEKDTGISLADVDTIKQKRPETEIFVYPGAQHGFNCDARASYDAPSAKLAWDRSLAFIEKAMKAKR